MDTKKAIKICFLLLLTLTPLLFTQFNSELFEVPKMFFVYVLTSIIIGLHVYNVVAGNAPLYRKSLINVFLLLFIFSQIVSTILSVDPHTSVFGYYSRLNGGLLSLTAYSLLYFIFSVYADIRFIDTLVKSALISGFFVATYGFLEHFGIDKNMWVQDVQARVFSTLGQPNWLAAFLCILLPFSLAKALDTYATKKSLLLLTLYSLLSFLFFTTLLFTKSKTGIIAAGLSLGLFFILYLYHNYKFRSRLLFLCFLYSFLVSLALSINSPLKESIFPVSSHNSTSDLPQLKAANPTSDAPSPLNITPSQDIRKIVWTGAIALWQQFPYFGTGPETFAYTYYWTRPVAHNLTSEWDFLYNKAHNEYINYLATTGSFGFITYTLLILTITIFLFRLELTPAQYGQSSTLSREQTPFTLAILAAFIANLINNFTGFSIVITSLYFFLFPALALSLRSLDHKSQYHRPSLFVTLGIVAVTIYLIVFTFSLSLADIMYASAQRADSANKVETAYEQINSAIFFNSREPLYYSLRAQILAKKAIISHQNQAAGTQNFADQAIIDTNKATTISPANLNLLKEQAQVYYYLATIDLQYYPKAISSLLKVARLAPTDPKTFYTMGKFWEAVGNNEESLANYEKAISLKSNYDYAYFSAAKLYFDQKDYPKAKDYFTHVLSIAPANADAKEYLSKIMKLEIRN